MFLYEYTIVNNKIVINELEAVELFTHYKTLTGNVYRKVELDDVAYFDGKKMYSLSNDRVDSFKRSIVDYYQAKINGLHDRINKLEDKQCKIMELKVKK